MLYPGIANEQFRVIQLIGFIVLVFGVLIYNEIALHKQVDNLYYKKGDDSKIYEDGVDKELTESLLEKERKNSKTITR